MSKSNNKQKSQTRITSPLAPMTPQQLRKQAQETMRAVYKPAFKQLGNEQKRMVSISEKRKADNAYYLNWLNQQSKEISAHDDAANAALLSAGQKSQQEVGDAYSGLRDQLVSSGETTPGVVSDVGDATAFDVSGQANRDEQLVNAVRGQTQGQIAATTGSQEAATASNFAQIAAAEATRVGDQWKGLSELGDARQKLRLSRAGDAAKEVARLLDREVQKAQIRGQLGASAATAAIEAKKFGLDVGKLELDKAKFGFEQEKFGKTFGLEKSKANETERYHIAETELKKSKTHEEKLKASYPITQQITEGVNFLASTPALKNLYETNPLKAKKKLAAKLGSVTAANAASSLYGTGKLNAQVRTELTNFGYIVPPKWR